MEFDIRGNLKPYDVIRTDWASFKTEFVEGFSKSRTRATIFASFSDYIEKVIAIIGLDFYVWIDGSFVTRKLDPGDIDFVVFVDGRAFNRNERAFRQLKEYSLERELRLDAYFVQQYPEGHNRFLQYKLDSIQWLNQFIKDSRKGQTKGFIQLNF